MRSPATTARVALVAKYSVKKNVKLCNHRNRSHFFFIQSTFAFVGNCHRLHTGDSWNDVLNSMRHVG